MSALLDRKYRALDDFVARVEESPISDRIAKLILYGSVLRGDAHEESDIDVLVVATDDLRQVGETCGDIHEESDIQKFGEVWTKTDLSPREMGRGLNKGFELSNQARCERHASMGENEAKVILALADQFIDALSAELGV
jgi:predicted nucleotidyltransferase